MNEFNAKYQEHIQGVLSGFDRLVFRGNIRCLCGLPGMEQYLATHHILYKEFGRHVEQVSRVVKEAALARAQREGRPVQFVSGSRVSKEEVARTIAARDRVQAGLVCVITSVEPCLTYDIFRNREQRQLQLVQRERKCLHIYQYWMHPRLGWLNARIQTWFPFRIQICLNGREWLVRSLEKKGLKHLRKDNCVVWAEDFAQAQALLDEQLKTDWAKLLDGLRGELNPAHEEIFARFHTDYYWSVYQSEWAVDVAFRSAGFLKGLYPKLLHHAMTRLGCSDVLRYLGRRIPLSGDVPAKFEGQVLSDLKQRPEGVRVKHGVNGNTVKMYDKAFTEKASVLRFETTVHNGDDFRVFRPKEGDPEGERQWRVLRRGIADLHRRAEISDRAAQRYMNAMSQVDDSTTIEELTRRLEKPVQWNGRRVRGLRVLDPADRRLLAAINRGEFTLQGLRNRDLQQLLFPAAAPSGKEARRRSALVSRKLRLLRAHGLIQKIAKTHRYQVTSNGRKAITAILAAMSATVAQLTKIAA